MATTQVSVEEYLKSVYKPDVEYINGELEERNVGELEHARMVKAVMRWFERYETSWRVEALSEVRVQVKAERYRVPDVCVCAASSTDTRIVTTAPLVVVEVLSPEDRIANYNERIADYIGMGIRGIWVIDPETRKGWDCSSGNWIETGVFRLAESAVYLDLSTTQ